MLDNIDQKKILEEVYDEMGIKMDTASFKFMIDQIRYHNIAQLFLPFEEHIKVIVKKINCKIN